MVGRTDIARCCCECEVSLPVTAFTRCRGDWRTEGERFEALQVGAGEFYAVDSFSKLLFSRRFSQDAWRITCHVQVYTGSAAAQPVWDLRLIGGNEEYDESSSSSSSNSSSSSSESGSSSSSSSSLSSSSSSSHSSSSSRSTDPYCERDGVYVLLSGDASGTGWELDDRSVPKCGPPVARETSYFYYLTLCWDGSKLTASATAGGSEVPVFSTNELFSGILRTNEVSPPGDRFGFAVGALTNIRYIKFSNVRLYQAFPVQADCPPCLSHCCEDGSAPPMTLQLELEFGPSEYQFLTGNTPDYLQPCYWGDCDDCNGTVVLSRHPSACNGDRFCEYSAAFQVTAYYRPKGRHISVCPFPDVSGVYDGLANIYIGASFSTGSRRILVGVVSHAVAGQSGSRYVANLQGVFPASCADWTDWISLSHTNNAAPIGNGNPAYGGYSDICSDISLISARIKVAS